jgi:phosphate transport system substrate-binding protein
MSNDNKTTPGSSAPASRARSRWLGILAAVVILAGALLWYQYSNPAAETPSASDVETLLRIHGSNTIGDKLMPALVKTFMEQEESCTGVRLKPAKKEDEAFVVGECNEERKQIEIFSHGSATAFADLGAGSADIGMASDRIDTKQQQDLNDLLGDLTSTAGEHVVALDGIAVIVHSSNPVSELSLLQLARIFGGTTTDWASVGGTSGSIHVYARDDKSGTWKFFNTAVLQKFGMTLTVAAQRIEKSEDLSDAVARDPQAIGFIGLNYVGSNRALALSEQGVEARKPTLCTVKTEEYLLARRLYLYTSTRPTPPVAHFIQFVTSKEAWPAVTEVGLVNMDPTPIPGCNTQGRHSEAWRFLTLNATRLLTNFTFVPNSSTLDTKAHLALGYVVGVLSTPEYADRKLLLIGYADSRGSHDQNKVLSIQRAAAVSKLLGRELARGGSSVTIDEIEGLGAQDFIASNDTPEGMQKNRRVEVWVRR